MLTFGKTGVFTIRSNSLVDNLGMTECRNFFLCYENLITYRAVLAFGKTGVFTIRSNSLVDNLGMTECRNFFLCYENLITYRTVLAFGKTCVFTIRSDSFINNLGVTECRNFFLSYENLITYRTVLAFGKTCILTIRSDCLVNNLGVTECSNFVCDIGVTARTGVLCITCAFAGRSNSSFGITVVAFGLYPSTVDILKFTTDATVISDKLNGFDGNCSVFGGFTVGTFHGGLVCGCLCTCVIQLNNSTVFTSDISTCGGDINITLGSIDGTCNMDMCIGISSMEGYACRLTGSIFNRYYSFTCFPTTVSKIAPIIGIVDINVISTAQFANCTFFHDHFCTGKNCNILCNGSLTAFLNNNSKVIGYGKVIFAGVNGLSTNQTQLHRDGQGLHANLTVDNNLQTVGCFIIILGD